jgi:hypothetical protein
MARDRVAQLRKAEETRKARLRRRAEPMRFEMQRAPARHLRLAKLKTRRERTRRVSQTKLRAEEARRAEVVRLEEARKTEAAKIASLPIEPTRPMREVPAADKTILARALQKELARVGCDPGAIDDKWGVKAKNALNEFRQLTKTSLPADDPSEDAVRAASEQKGRICPLRCASDEKETNGRCVTKLPPRAARPALANDAQKRKVSEKQENVSEYQCWARNNGCPMQPPNGQYTARKLGRLPPPDHCLNILPRKGRPRVRPDRYSRMSASGSERTRTSPRQCPLLTQIRSDVQSGHTSRLVCDGPAPPDQRILAS